MIPEGQRHFNKARGPDRALFNDASRASWARLLAARGLTEDRRAGRSSTAEEWVQVQLRAVGQ